MEALAALGDEVLVIDDLSTGHAEWIPGQRVVAADVNSDEARLAITTFRPESVVLLAAQPNVKTSMRDPLLDAQINVVGLLRVMESAVEVGCSSFVFASSGGTIYGDVPISQQPIQEHEPYRPRSFYGVSKAAGVLYLDVYAHNFGVRCVSLALGNVYGPRQNPAGEAGVVALFAERLVNGEQCTINGDGQTTRDFVHVRDVADAFAIATRRGSGLINLGTGIPVSVLEIYDTLAGYVDRDRSWAAFGPPLPGEVRAVALDPGEARRQLGWGAETSLREGLHETINWVAAQACNLPGQSSLIQKLGGLR
ncbi:MAG: NAD-dependent epimerase/dehydratase family protein [Paenarthrobacter ureafaciens]|nr:NAD-dependent epimerase/dehydratase family protein [Paenarthrobacter ureafaciens]